MFLEYELNSVGVMTPNGISYIAENNNIKVFDRTQANSDLIDAVCVSHGKVFMSDECTALRDYLGGETDPRWIAYVDARKAPTRAKRAERYRVETDSLLMKAFESGEGAVDTVIDGKLVRCPDAEKVEAWEAAKTKIREELPYE